MTLIGLALLLVVSGLGPGLWVLRRCHWAPLETLCASIGLSFLMLYFWAWIGSLTGFLPLAASLWSLIALGLTLVVRKDVVGLWREESVRVSVLAWIALLFWVLLLQSLIRHYGGADWSGDWYEHYQRAVYFTLWPLDSSFLFIDRYLLPARPPLMNILAADVVAQLGSAFPIFQVFHSVLSTLIFLPVLALAGSFKPARRLSPWILAIFFALSPLFCQNATYTWTRLFTGFYVVLGLILYLNAWRLKDEKRMIGAFAALAAGLLTHYSAGPYLVILAAHYLVVLWRNRPRAWRELVLIVGAGSIILLSWFGWSLAVYGTRATLGSNTSVTESEKLTPGQNLVKIGLNVERTLIPFPFHRSLPEDRQRFAPGVLLRDTSFLLYQNNFVFAMGSLNWIVIFVLLFRGLRKGRDDTPPSCRFWVMFIGGTLFLGIAVHGALTDWGLAHICLQPLVLMALGFLAVQFTRLELPLKGLVIAGLLADFLLGIALHVFLLHSNINPGLGTITTFNWLIKKRVGLVFLGDLMASWGPVLQVVFFVTGLALVLALVVIGWRSASGRKRSDFPENDYPEQEGDSRFS